MATVIMMSRPARANMTGSASAKVCLTCLEKVCAGSRNDRSRAGLVVLTMGQSCARNLATAATDGKRTRRTMRRTCRLDDRRLACEEADGCLLALTFSTPRVSVTSCQSVPIELDYALEFGLSTDAISRFLLHDRTVG